MTFYTGNRFLTREEMTVNAKYVYRYLSKRGWTLNAICAMLGNMETESTINPGIWQNLDEGNTALGYGLVQWTPATKYLDWCAENGLDDEDLLTALIRIEYELENRLQWIKTDAYPLNFADFKTSEEDISYLANAFLVNYERPADQEQPARASQALAWYDVLKGLDAGNDEEKPKPAKENKLPLWLLIASTRRKVR